MDIIYYLKNNKTTIYFYAVGSKKSTIDGYYSRINNLTIQSLHLNYNEIHFLLENNNNKYDILFALIKLLSIYNEIHNHIIEIELKELDFLLFCYKKNNIVLRENITYNDIKNKLDYIKIVRNQKSYLFDISIEIKYVLLSIYYFLPPIKNNKLINCNKLSFIENKLFLTDKIIEIPQNLLNIINDFFKNTKQDFLFPQITLYQKNIYKQMDLKQLDSMIRKLFPKKIYSYDFLNKIY